MWNTIQVIEFNQKKIVWMKIKIDQIQVKIKFLLA